MIGEVSGKKPKFRGDNYFVAENAVVIGNVSIGNNVGIWFGAVVCGDEDAIIIGDDTNIQDNCVLHVDLNCKLVIGSRVTIGHAAVVHGCTIEDDCLIGMGAIILNGAIIGKNCIIGASALIPENKVIPERSVVMGTPGRIVRELNDEDIKMIQLSVRYYVKRMADYKDLRN